MAGGEDPLPDASEVKFIKNHPGKQFSCVVCVMCEDVFQKIKKWKIFE